MNKGVLCTKAKDGGGLEKLISTLHCLPLPQSNITPQHTDLQHGVYECGFLSKGVVGLVKRRPKENRIRLWMRCNPLLCPHKLSKKTVIYNLIMILQS